MVMVDNIFPYLAANPALGGGDGGIVDDFRVVRIQKTGIDEKAVIRQEIVEELLSGYCYVCHKRFFLECGAPVVKIGGCCSGAYWGKTRYVMPVYAHLNCYMSKVIKRKSTIFKEETIKSLMRAYARRQVRESQKDINSEMGKRYPELARHWKEEIAVFKGWLVELDGHV